MAFAQRLGVSPIAVNRRVKTLLCAKCHTSLLDEPDHPVICDVAEHMSIHDHIKTTGLKAHAVECGVHAQVEPSQLHPKD